MKSYLVIFELRSKKDYEGFYQAILSFGQNNHSKIFDNVWMILTDHSAQDVYEYLSKYLNQKKDGLMVVKPIREATWDNIDSPDEWFMKYL